MRKVSRKRLLELVDRFDRVRVLAYVDLVADEYIYGQISNVSREAPVLILKYDRTQLVPGGGANAVANIASLGGKPLTVGLLGKEESISTLEMKINFLKPVNGGEMLAEAKIIHRGTMTAIGDVEVKNEDDVLVAKGLVTYAIYRK